MPTNGISRRHKDTDRGTEQIFEIFASIGDPLCQMSTASELLSTVRLIVIVTVEHYLKTPLRGPNTEVIDERLVLM
jgi:hypothetical protein